MAAQVRGNGSRVGIGWRLAVWGGATLLLSLPLLAMRLGAPGVHWTGLDFAVMGAMLAAACGGWELAMRMSSGNLAYRAAACVAIAACFLQVWVNLAVGIVGEPGNPANLAFFAVVALAIAGALVARFRAPGMAQAMHAAAAAQAAAGAIALANGSPEGAVLSLFFMLAWLGAAWLFRRAAR